MNKFEYRRVAGPEDAARELAAEPGARLLAGGTDLIPLMKEGIEAPVALVDLAAWQEGTGIEETDEGLRIGALASLASLASHPLIRSRYGALSDACRLSAAPQLRNMGTIGGNLLQQTRCWYFRGPFACWLKGGEVCFARDGENEQHAIYRTDWSESICVSAHPSDPAAALLALDAEVEYVGPSGRARLPLSRLYALPTEQRRTFTSLPSGAVITSIILPAARAGSRSVYRKAMARATWAFALAGIALFVRLDGNTIIDCRIALSGVSPIPLRVENVEEKLRQQEIGGVDVANMARMLTAEARPLAMNGYKVELVAGLFAEALGAVRKPRRPTG